MGVMVRLPQYKNIRIFLYKGYRFINLSAQTNGIAQIVRSPPDHVTPTPMALFPSPKAGK